MSAQGVPWHCLYCDKTIPSLSPGRVVNVCPKCRRKQKKEPHKLESGKCKNCDSELIEGESICIACGVKDEQSPNQEHRSSQSISSDTVVDEVNLSAALRLVNMHVGSSNSHSNELSLKMYTVHMTQHQRTNTQCRV